MGTHNYIDSTSYDVAEDMPTLGGGVVILGPAGNSMAMTETIGDLTSLRRTRHHRCNNVPAADRSRAATQYAICRGAALPVIPPERRATSKRTYICCRVGRGLKCSAKLNIGRSVPQAVTAWCKLRIHPTVSCKFETVLRAEPHNQVIVSPLL